MDEVQIRDLATIDSDEGLQVLTQAGPTALAVMFLLEVLKPPTGMKLTTQQLAKYGNLPLPEVDKACYRLGLVKMGIVVPNEK
jgi:hypothetical protein